MSTRARLRWVTPYRAIGMALARAIGEREMVDGLNLSERGYAVRRITPASARITAETKEYPLTYLEKTGEEHIDYMIMANQLRSFNIHTTPLMIASELHKLKKLLDRVIEHLPSVVTLSQKGSSDHDVLSDQYHAIFTTLKEMFVFLRTLNQLMKTEDRVDYFLDAFQVSLDKFHTKAQEVFWPIESTKQDPPTVVKQQQEQTIVYAASIRQPKLHSNVNDGCLLHQGFLWKRNGSSETRFWALLFTDSLLFTHVNNGVHFVEEEPILLCNMVRLLAAENQLNPVFRLVYRASDKARIGKVSIHLGCSVVTMRAKDRTQKLTWVDLIRRQMDELQNREHCWNTASLCDKGEAEGQQLRRGSNNNSSGRSLRGSGIAILRRVHRCLSSGAIPIPASMPIATPTSLSLQPTTVAGPAFYQSYSCDDLYLASDLTPGRNFSSSSEPIAEQQCETPTPSAEEDGREQQPDQEAAADADELVFEGINLDNPAASTETRGEDCCGDRFCLWPMLKAIRYIRNAPRVFMKRSASIRAAERAGLAGVNQSQVIGIFPFGITNRMGAGSISTCVALL
ncbi:hypothetical protein DAPPUDRAFT_107853 [Daphnia pulex]|uniref:PH domain-containing protein n=1 Tax=Daphnia pulex TaxID=6669 RepID=E9GYF9_DAPPU|nr:hypothetical protein DAPPUDRAFT_107853 [Daphnia pulex]|eukprot:EFX75379.1 hypothetical protein DAPPUDRAFT_107853 [Daphnia pulex]